MKPLIVSATDGLGGADRAAFRVLSALRKFDVDAEMLVLHKYTDCYYVNKPNSKIERLWTVLRNIMANRIQNLQKTENKDLHSGNWFRSHLLKNINTFEVDLVNLHWCNAETLSIKQIASINKPIVMTLHDMWAFCGSEHYVVDSSIRFKEGYLKSNREQGEKGVDIDRKVWERKKKYWQIPFSIVTPSDWLSQCVSESNLFTGWPIFTIPNALDTTLYKPLDKNICREILGLPKDILLIGFGAINTKDFRKGFDLLLDSLNHLSNSVNLLDIACVVVGQTEPKEKLKLNIPIHYMGRFYDDYTMALFYNAIDIMVVPSRQENLPQTATEAQACGTPVVAFNCTGLTSAIEHNKTGYLAKAYDSEDLAEGIRKILTDQDNYKLLQKNARERAVELWSQEVVSKQYIELYKKVLASS
ncbi:glycosyltransferase [Entomomonas sp. E2T0]|uniref:glycosyltransferase n=1 Tax=Entomomonas sp. E2T0 TaxID=2930213 RepID=UPI0022284F21|nr:glycosyltransferase [Entomomonas sp. E2T0]UYZ82608.1 glycosyltransferase [Entomomonas sp. E2T0]